MVFDTYMTRLKRYAGFGLLAAVIVGYFVFHAINGEHGILAHGRYEERVVTLKTELDDLKTRRQGLENRIALLKSESLDPDMLEEQARGALNLAHPRDVLLMMKR